MNVEDFINSAHPAKYFNLPPFRVELFSKETGRAGVMNRNNVNCLTFNGSGAVLTNFEGAKLIAEKWNNENK